MRYSSNLIFTEAAVLDIRQHYLHKNVLRLFKNKQKLPFIKHNYETRQKAKNNLETQTSKKRIGQRNHIFLGNRFYNMLPTNIRDARTIHSFSKQTKIYLLSCERNYIRQFF